MIYAEELLAFELCDARGALRKLARQPRDTYQTAFPNLGTVIEAVEACAQRRLNPPLLRYEGEYVSCGKHIIGDLVYVDGDGNPCEVGASDDRRLGTCPCKREWQANRDAWPARATDDSVMEAGREYIRMER